MVDFLLCYFILGIVWAFQLEVVKARGFWMRVGFVVFLPLVLVVLLLNKEYKLR